MTNILIQLANSLPLSDLKEMAKELVEFRNTSILPNAKIREFSKEVHQILGTDVKYSEAFGVAIELIKDEIIDRFAQ